MKLSRIKKDPPFVIQSILLSSLDSSVRVVDLNKLMNQKEGMGLIGNRFDFSHPPVPLLLVISVLINLGSGDGEALSVVKHQLRSIVAVVVDVTETDPQSITCQSLAILTSSCSPIERTRIVSP